VKRCSDGFNWRSSRIAVAVIPGKRSRLFMRIMFRALLLAPAWWALTEGDASSWLFGIPVLVSAALASTALAPAQRVRWRFKGFVAFAGFFLLASLRSGIDVARRALHPRLPIDPAFVRFEFRLPKGPAQVFLVNTISLLPGTLSVELQETSALIHVLDERLPFARTLRNLEGRVAELFGLELVSGRFPGGKPCVNSR